LNDVTTFKPDVLIDRPTELKIGGTRIELIPVKGGRPTTPCSSIPGSRTLFVGDFIMPFLGAPSSRREI